MAPHPLIHQELLFEPTYFVYNRRLAAASMNNLASTTMLEQTRAVGQLVQCVVVER